MRPSSQRVAGRVLCANPKGPPNPQERALISAYSWGHLTWAVLQKKLGAGRVSVLAQGGFVSPPGRTANKKLLELLSRQPGVDTDDAEDALDALSDLVSKAMRDAVVAGVRALSKAKPAFSGWAYQDAGVEDPDDADIYYSLRLHYPRRAKVVAAGAVDLGRRLRSWEHSALLGSREIQDEIKGQVAAWEWHGPSDSQQYAVREAVLMELTADSSYEEYAETRVAGEDDAVGGEFPDTRVKWETRVTSSAQAAYERGRVVVRVGLQFDIEVQDVAYPWDWYFDRY